MKTVTAAACIALLFAVLNCQGAERKPLEPRPTFKWKDWTAELSPDGNIQHLFLSYDEGEELKMLTRLAKEMEEKRRQEHGIEPNEWKIIYCLSKETDMIFRAVDGTRYRETAGMGRGDLEWALLNEQQYYDAAYGYSRGNVKIVPTDRVMEEPLLGEYQNVCFFWPRGWPDLGIGIDTRQYDSIVGHYYPGETRPWARGGTGGGGGWCDHLGHTSVQFAPGREVGGSLGDLGKITLHEWLHQIDGQKGWKCGYIGLPGQYSPGNYHHGSHLFWMWQILPPRMWQTMRMQAPLMSPPNKPQDRYSGFIQNWLLLGEFDLPAEIKSSDAGIPHPDALDHDTIDVRTTVPSNDMEEAGKKWQLYKAEWNRNSIPMRRTFHSPHEDAYAYAHTYVYSPDKREAVLWVGGHEPFVAYLNGHKVLKCWRGVAEDEASRKVVLNKGWNRLLIKKLDQEDSNWNLFARFTDPKHIVFEDLKFAADKPESDIVSTSQAGPAPPVDVKRYKWEWPYNNDWFGSLPILTEEHLDEILGVKGVRILGAPGTLNGRGLDWTERRYTLIDVSAIDKPENILSRVVPWSAAKATLENDVLLNNVLNMSTEGADGRSYESMAVIRYRKPDGGHGDLVFVRADMIEPFMDLAKSAGGSANPANNILGFICRDSKTFLIFDTDLGEQLPINELDMLAVKDENATLTAAPSEPRVLRGKPVNVNVKLVAPDVEFGKLTAREFGTDKIMEAAIRMTEEGAFHSSFPVDTDRPAGLITYIIQAAYKKDGETHTLNKPVPINLVDAVGIEIRVDGPELLQVPKHQITIKVTNNLDRAVSGTLKPKLPRGFSVKPRSQKINLTALDETQTFTFDLNISTRAPEGWLTLAAEAQVPDEAICRGELDVYKSFNDTLVNEDFEEGVGGDFAYTNAHYQVKLNRQAAKFGRQCLEVYDRGGQRYGHVSCFSRSFWPGKRLPDTQYVYDTSIYPIVDFWFKTDAKTDNLGLHIVLDNGENGYGILINGFWVQQWVPRVMIGKADFTPDGEWHHIVLNIDEMLDQVLGDTSHFVREVLIGDTRTFSSGWWYYFDAHQHYIDNFQIRRDPGVKTAELEHRIKSPTGLPILSQASPIPAFDSEIVDGVKATCRLTRLGYMPWETPQLQMWVTNHSDNSISIATNEITRLWEMSITTPDGTPVTDGWISRFWKPELQNYKESKSPPQHHGIPHAADHFRDLKPGESWYIQRNLVDFFGDWANVRKRELEPDKEHPHAWKEYLAAGNEYVVTMRYRSEFTGDEFGHSAWTGTAPANPVRLTMIGVPSKEEELEALTTSIDPVRRAKACAQLGKEKYEPAVPALCKALLEDEDGDVRLNAAWALGEYGRFDPEKPETADKIRPNAEALIEALDDENWRVGEYAASSLGRLRAWSATPYLLKRLDSPSKWIRRKTAEALGETLDPAAVDKLGQIMNDESREVRLAGADALVKITLHYNQLYEVNSGPLRNLNREYKNRADERDKLVQKTSELDQKIKNNLEEIGKLQQEIEEHKQAEQPQSEEIKKLEQKTTVLKQEEQRWTNEVKQLNNKVADLDKRDQDRAEERKKLETKATELKQLFDKAYNAGNLAVKDEFWEIRNRWIGSQARLMRNADIWPILLMGIKDKNERVRETGIWRMGDYLAELERIGNDKGKSEEEAAAARQKLEMARERVTPIVIDHLDDYHDFVRNRAVEQFTRITGKDIVELSGKDGIYWRRKYPRPGDNRYRQ